MTSRKKIEERFWKKVQKGDPCWLWVGAGASRKEKHDYGQFWFPEIGKTIPATHFSFLLKFGRLPLPGKQINHTCDNPPCVHPDHIYEGTQIENMEDAIGRGRRADKYGCWANPPKGEAHHGAKLTDDDIRAIRIRYDSGNETLGEIAPDYRISRMAVSKIGRRLSWAHVS